jgi:hypothetical protein
MGMGAGLASSYLERWVCNTQEPVRLTNPENVATNFWVNYNSQAGSGLHLLQILANTSHDLASIFYRYWQILHFHQV